MATTASKHYMRAEETKRLIAAMNALAEREGVEPVDVMPRFRDKDLESIQVIKNMADFIEALLGVELTVLTADEPVIPQRYLDAERLAREGATKAEIVDMLLSEPEVEDASA